MTARTGAPVGWWVTTAEAKGAHHVAREMPYEDACAVGPDSARETDQAELVVAVADGHGHARHFRSATGSKLAVKIATEMGTRMAGQLAGLGEARRAEAYMRAQFGPDLVTAWRAAVRDDLARDPVREDEYKAAGLTPDASFDELVYGYGATLLVTIATGRWLLCLQLGDGDLFVVGPSGTVRKPMPVDPRLDGLRTTSLCQPDAADSIRYAVIDTSKRDIGAVMLATDGYGNAQVRNDWEVAFGADLAALTAEHGARWIGEQLPAWVRRCASSEGSGDDVTAALMFASGTTWEAPPAVRAAEATLPDVAAAAAVTVPITAATAATPAGAPRVPAAATVPAVATDGERTVLLAPDQPGPPRQPVETPSPALALRPPVAEPPAPRRSRRLVLTLAAITVIAFVVLLLLVVLLVTRAKPATPAPKPSSPVPSISVPSSAQPGPGQVGTGPDGATRGTAPEGAASHGTSTPTTTASAGSGSS